MYETFFTILLTFIIIYIIYGINLSISNCKAKVNGNLIAKLKLQFYKKIKQINWNSALKQDKDFHHFIVYSQV